jgi:hypothetical protein
MTTTTIPMTNDITGATLLACLTAGLVLQFVLALALVGYEQRILRWSRIEEALWLDRPDRRPRTAGPHGGPPATDCVDMEVTRCGR